MRPLPIMERFDKLLLELPAVLDGLTHEVSRQAARWLKEASSLAEEYQLPCAADLALELASLAAFRPGHGASTADKRGLHQRHVIDCLSRANGCIKEMFARQRTACQDCEALCMQAAAVALARGLIHPGDDVHTLTAKLRTDEALLPVLTQIIGMVGASNATVLLDRALSLTEQKPANKKSSPNPEK